MKPRPLVKSFLIADQVFRQEGNNKWCIVGIFDTIAAAGFPTAHPSLGLYLQLSDAEGRYDLRLELQDSSSRCLAVLGSVQLEVGNRLANVELGFQGYNLVIPSAGNYFLNLFIDGDPSGVDIRLHAIQR
jgi:uncharacterized protein DUF6941